MNLDLQLVYWYKYEKDREEYVKEKLQSMRKKRRWWTKKKRKKKMR